MYISFRRFVSKLYSDFLKKTHERKRRITIISAAISPHPVKSYFAINFNQILPIFPSNH